LGATGVGIVDGSFLQAKKSKQIKNIETFIFMILFPFSL